MRQHVVVFVTSGQLMFVRKYRSHKVIGWLVCRLTGLCQRAWSTLLPLCLGNRKGTWYKQPTSKVCVLHVFLWLGLHSAELCTFHVHVRLNNTKRLARNVDVSSLFENVLVSTVISTPNTIVFYSVSKMISKTSSRY